MKIQLSIEGRILSKKNIINFSNKGFYRTKEWYDFEDNNTLLLSTQFKKQTLHKLGPLQELKNLNVEFYLKRDKDLDNLLGTIFDLLQKSLIIKNDILITRIVASKQKFDTERAIISFDI